MGRPLGSKNTRPFPQSGKEKISLALTGKRLSKAHRHTLSEAAKKRWIEKPLVFTRQHCKNIGDGNRGRKFSPEHIAKLKAAVRPPITEEAKRKMSEARKARLRAMLPPLEERRRVRRLSMFLRNCIHKLGIKGTGYIRMQAILGYNREQLRERLETQFLDGMTWDNYGSVWTIDHICPVSIFIRIGELDPAVVNALSNLQPLWKLDNIRKGAKIA